MYDYQHQRNLGTIIAGMILRLDAPADNAMAASCYEYHLNMHGLLCGAAPHKQ